VELLAAPQADLQLGVAPVVDVEAERDEGQALRLRPAEELVDLVLVEEELASALRLVVPAVAGRVRGDVGADEPGLTAVDPGVGLLQAHLAGPDRLDLRAGQDDASLEGVLDAELVARLAVEGDGLLAHGEWSSWLVSSGPM